MACVILVLGVFNTKYDALHVLNDRTVYGTEYVLSFKLFIYVYTKP